ncbi:MAG: 50S ribosomal protein L10 [Thermodesulfobacteriota bacterium]|nr:50S ribosomal protein L10 [Thermodesulfobacteriota bacterium]
MLKLSEKKELVEDLQSCFQKAAILILTDYKGLTVESVNELRRKLKDAGVEYRVVKNTLLRRAVADTDMAVVTDDFIGPMAIAIGYDDPVEPAKVLANFAKDNEKLEIKAGVMNGSRLAVDNIIALSKLPSREVLLSQFLSVLNGVPTSFVRVLNGVPQKLVYALSAIRDQKDAA